MAKRTPTPKTAAEAYLAAKEAEKAAKAAATAAAAALRAAYAKTGTDEVVVGDKRVVLTEVTTRTFDVDALLDAGLDAETVAEITKVTVVPKGFDAAYEVGLIDDRIVDKVVTEAHGDRIEIHSV